MSVASPDFKSRPSDILSEIDMDRLYFTGDLEKLGVDRKAIRRLVAQDLLESPAHGVYLHPGHEPHMLDDLAVVAKRCPEGVFNLYTAARYHEITQVMPSEIWIGIPHKNAPAMGGSFHLGLRVLRWSKPSDIETDIETLSLRGAELRFTGLARTVVDMWRYSSHNPSLKGQHSRIHDESLLQCMGAYLEKTNGAARELAAAARRLDMGATSTNEFIRFCQHYSGGFNFSQTF